MRACLLACLVLCATSAGEAAAPPWEQEIAALTDQRASVFDPAIESLIRMGEPCLDDLAALRSDDDWRVRMRIATVAAGIGGAKAFDLVRSLSHDNDAHVREITAQALGKLSAPGAYERLAELLKDREPSVRATAALGLDELGDARAIVDLAAWGREADESARKAMREHLVGLCARPASVPPLAQRLGEARGDELYALLEASALIADPRLSLPLAALLTSSDLRAATLAARALGADGDSRALHALTTAADDRYRPLADAATATLQALTGHGAASGPAWGLWWRDHADAIAGLAERDAFIADLHDVSRAVTRADLARFSADQLMPLVDGALGAGAWWWPARAYAALRLDDAARWTAPLAKRIEATAGDERLALIVLLDQLGDPGAAETFAELLERSDAEAAREAKEGHPGFNHPERAALKLAIERRHAPATGGAEAPATRPVPKGGRL